ncbi:MAG: OmpA family protein [Pseudomonadota bacterium]
MEKQQKREQVLNEAPVAGWQTIYSSVAMILVVFFIMMAANSSVSRHKTLQAVRYFQADAASGGKHAAPAGSIRQKTEAPDVRRSAEAPGNDDDLLRFFRRSGVQPGVSVHVHSEGLFMRINSRALFTQGSGGISGRTAASLHEAVKIALARSLFIRVEGHTENLSATGGDVNASLKMSAVMAAHVRRYLLEEEKFPRDRLIAAGFGSYRPLHTNETEEGRIGNRRIEIILTRQR